MAFEIRYPDESSPTTSWLPSVDPIADGHVEAHGPPAIVHRMPDGNFYSYFTSSRADAYFYRFRGLTTTDKTNLVTAYNVILGAQFRVKDPVLGTYYTAKFHPDLLARGLSDWEPYGASFWSVSLPILQVAA